MYVENTANQFLNISIEPFFNIPKFVIDKSGYITNALTPGTNNDVDVPILIGSRTEKVNFTICSFLL